MGGSVAIYTTKNVTKIRAIEAKKHILAIYPCACLSESQYATHTTKYWIIDPEPNNSKFDDFFMYYTDSEDAAWVAAWEELNAAMMSKLES